MPSCSHAYGECLKDYINNFRYSMLGSQTLCILQSWGVRKITLLDNGRVAMSNPLRQSLYTLDDCLNGGDFKAEAAVKSLKRIFPAVVIYFTPKISIRKT